MERGGYGWRRPGAGTMCHGSRLLDGDWECQQRFYLFWIETTFSFVDYCMLLMEVLTEDYLGIGRESNDFWIGL